MIESIKYRNNLTQLGFTLVELMVTVAIMGIIASIAIPSFTKTIAQNRTQQAAMDIVSVFDEARAGAALSNKPATISLVPGSDNRKFTVSFLDRSPAGGTNVIKQFELNDSVWVSTNMLVNPNATPRKVIQATSTGGIQTMTYTTVPGSGSDPDTVTVTPSSSTYYFRICDGTNDISGYSLTINSRGIAKYQPGPLEGNNITSNNCM